MNIHGRPARDQKELTLRPSRLFGRWWLDDRRFWLTGIAFLAVYLALNKLTEWHDFDGLGITIWSPDNGLSLLLLIERAEFAPFVFVAAVLTDVFVVGVHHSLPVTIAAEFVLTVGYVGMAALLRHTLKFDPRSSRDRKCRNAPDFRTSVHDVDGVLVLRGAVSRRRDTRRQVLYGYAPFLGR